MKRLFIGTAGYSYDDWVGPVYPLGTPKSQYLAHYARRFAMGELNFSYYRMPSAPMLLAIMDKAPGVHWALKAHGSMTHERNATAAHFAQFREAAEVLRTNDRLIAVLLQFPTSFHLNDSALEWLRHLREGLADLPLVAEFRGREWVNEATVLPLLRELEIGWCAVDEPALDALMPPVAAVTSSIAYVRFHGRNAAQWFKHEHPWQRYDYRYTEEELLPWVPKIVKMMEKAETVAAIFNNHYGGQAVDNAEMLARMLPDEVTVHLVKADPMELPLLRREDGL